MNILIYSQKKYFYIKFHNIISKNKRIIHLICNYFGGKPGR